MMANYKKEMRQYFTSMTFYVFLTAFFLMAGISFFSSNLLTQSGDITNFFTSLSSQILFVIPLITMRTFSEEKKMKTVQLLYTLPLKESEIILGKFAACVSCFGFGLAFAIVYPIILNLLGATQIIITVGNYFGLFLLGSMLISIGIFISSLTENQMIAAIISYCIFALLWVSNILLGYIQSSLLKQILQHISLVYNYRTFTLGIFDVKNIVYYISITTFFLCLTTYSLKFNKTCN